MAPIVSKEQIRRVLHQHLIDHEVTQIKQNKLYDVNRWLQRGIDQVAIRPFIQPTALIDPRTHDIPQYMDGDALKVTERGSYIHAEVPAAAGAATITGADLHAAVGRGSLTGAVQVQAIYAAALCDATVIARTFELELQASPALANMCLPAQPPTDIDFTDLTLTAAQWGVFYIPCNGSVYISDNGTIALDAAVTDISRPFNLPYTGAINAELTANGQPDDRVSLHVIFKLLNEG